MRKLCKLLAKLMNRLKLCEKQQVWLRKLCELPTKLMNLVKLRELREQRVENLKKSFGEDFACKGRMEACNNHDECCQGSCYLEASRYSLYGPDEPKRCWNY